ncbi:hypothetical protein JHK84_042921 [Glycine max]|nr:hypothetical protein JHK84_042921 [Glycine max]
MDKFSSTIPHLAFANGVALFKDEDYLVKKGRVVNVATNGKIIRKLEDGDGKCGNCAGRGGSAPMASRSCCGCGDNGADDSSSH